MNQLSEQLQAAGISWKVYGTPDGDFGDNVLPYFKKYMEDPALLANARLDQLVMITAVEPFSKSQRVRADEGHHAKADVAQVIKLNLLRSFRTGVVPRNDMLSTFVWLEPVDNRPDGMLS